MNVLQAQFGREKPVAIAAAEQTQMLLDLEAFQNATQGRRHSREPLSDDLWIGEGRQLDHSRLLRFLGFQFQLTTGEPVVDQLHVAVERPQIHVSQ
jgi:hypothetical protein